MVARGEAALGAREERRRAGMAGAELFGWLVRGHSEDSFPGTHRPRAGVPRTSEAVAASTCIRAGQERLAAHMMVETPHCSLLETLHP